MDDKKEEIKAEILENREEIIENNKEIKKLEEKVEEVNKEEKKIQENNIEKEQKVKKIDKNKEESDKRVAKQKAEYEFKKEKSKKRKHRVLILALLLTFMLIVIGVLSTIFALINSNNDRILKGISVRNVLLEGLTEEEAVKILSSQLEDERTKEIILNINDEKYTITPEQIEAQYKIEEAVEKAYNIGRSGSIVQNNFEIINTYIKNQNINIEIEYNDKILENIIKDYSAKIGDAVVDNSYYIENDELVIIRGKDGIAVDVKSAKVKIIDRIINGKDSEVVLDIVYKKCPQIDIEKIHSEVHTEPQNATYITEPFEIIPHKNGIDFNVEEAKELLKEDKEEYTIKLIIIEPEIHTNELGEEAFPNLLGIYSTKFDETNISRTTNVKLALEKLNGVIVMPGEVFSYNKTLGKRTAEAGYEYANGYSGGKVVPMLGGGICQVSSTLYNAVLYANLEIVERYNHMFQAQYVPAGRDATVVYGSLDFKFKNARQYPIMIKTKSNGGLAEIKIFGIREAVEYEIEIVPTVLSYEPFGVIYENDASMAEGTEKVLQGGIDGCKTITYKITKLNGREISKEELSTDTYSPLNKTVKRGTKK